MITARDADISPVPGSPLSQASIAAPASPGSRRGKEDRRGVPGPTALLDMHALVHEPGLTEVQGMGVHREDVALEGVAAPADEFQVGPHRQAAVMAMEAANASVVGHASLDEAAAVAAASAHPGCAPNVVAAGGAWKKPLPGPLSDETVPVMLPPPQVASAPLATAHLTQALGIPGQGGGRAGMLPSSQASSVDANVQYAGSTGGPRRQLSTGSVHSAQSHPTTPAGGGEASGPIQPSFNLQEFPCLGGGKHPHALMNATPAPVPDVQPPVHASHAESPPRPQMMQRSAWGGRGAGAANASSVLAAEAAIASAASPTAVEAANAAAPMAKSWSSALKATTPRGGATQGGNWGGPTSVGSGRGSFSQDGRGGRGRGATGGGGRFAHGGGRDGDGAGRGAGGWGPSASLWNQIGRPGSRYPHSKDQPEPPSR